MLGDYSLWASLGLYTLIVYIIAYHSSLKTKKLGDYILGGRSLSGPITALGAGASDMSGWLLMGLPGAAYIHGANTIWIALSLCCGAYLNWLLVSGRLRAFTEVFNDSMTLPEYLRARFTDNESDILLKVIVSGIFVIFFTIYSASGLIAGALLLKSIFSLSYSLSLFIITVIILFYTALGGFLAVNRVDFFQGILMFLALIIVPVTLYNQVDNPISIVNEMLPNHLNVFADMNILLIISYAAWGLGYFGQPHILVRFMAVKSIKELPSARRICMLWMSISLAGAISVGILGRVIFPEALSDPEVIFILSSKSLFAPFITGLLLSAVLSAIMSTVSALLLMSSSAMVGDILQTISKKPIDDRKLILLSKAAVVFISIFSYILAFSGDSKVLSVVAFAWSGLGAAFGPVILFGLYYRKMSYKAAISGMVTGASVVLVWNLLITKLLSKELLTSVKPGFELLPGFILSAATILIVTKVSPQESKSIINKFDASVRESRA